MMAAAVGETPLLAKSKRAEERALAQGGGCHLSENYTRAATPTASPVEAGGRPNASAPRGPLGVPGGGTLRGSEWLAGRWRWASSLAG